MEEANISQLCVSYSSEAAAGAVQGAQDGDTLRSYRGASSSEAVCDTFYMEIRVIYSAGARWFDVSVCGVYMSVVSGSSAGSAQ